MPTNIIIQTSSHSQILKDIKMRFIVIYNSTIIQHKCCRYYQNPVNFWIIPRMFKTIIEILERWKQNGSLSLIIIIDNEAISIW